MQVEPVILENDLVRLEPLLINHLEALCEVGLDKTLWKLIPTFIHSAQDMKRYIETALDEQRRGAALPFATIDKTSNTIVGSTRFGNIDVKNLRAEIGWTWINPKWQRSFVNTAAKFLMLRHAFEKWKCIRVELKTDALNERSRSAILRIGATQEGIFRRHVITESGRVRDTVYFSILDSEWDKVKENLLAKLPAES